MALGKLWNAFFGKRAAVDKELPDSNGTLSPAPQPLVSTRADRPVAKASAHGAAAISANASVAVTIPDDQLGERQPPILAKGKRRSTSKRGRTPSPVGEAAVVPLLDPVPRAAPRIAQPQKNAWTKLISGRQIRSILDTHPGDGARAVEILQAIVCDAVPPPKYVAIDLFELGGSALTVLEFHRRIRGVGGQPVAIPAGLTAGLRQLSQTLGAVDLVLLDGSEIDLEQLELHRLLTRVTHSESLILHRDARGKWQSVATLATSQRPAEIKSRAA